MYDCIFTQNENFIIILPCCRAYLEIPDSRRRYGFRSQTELLRGEVQEVHVGEGVHYNAVSAETHAVHSSEQWIHQTCSKV